MPQTHHMTGVLFSYQSTELCLNTENKGVLWGNTLLFQISSLWDPSGSWHANPPVQGIAVSASPWELPLWMFAGEGRVRSLLSPWWASREQLAHCSHLRSHRHMNIRNTRSFKKGFSTDLILQTAQQNLFTQIAQESWEVQNFVSCLRFLVHASLHK